MAEFIVLNFDYYIAMQNPVVENKVCKILLVIDYHPFLPGLKAEPFSQFQKEFLQMQDKGILKV